MKLNLDQNGSLKREIIETSFPQHWKDELHTSSCCGTDVQVKGVGRQRQQ